GAPMLELGMKYVVARPRPPHSLVTHNLFHLTHGFPSGHALSAAALYGLLLVLVQPSLRRRGWRVGGTGGLLLPSLLIRRGRLYLNAHWLRDVVGGVYLRWSVLHAGCRGTGVDATEESNPARPDWDR